ncbi:MAG: hypothetical protein JO288_03265 [Hyphomicrobiales bacterium]|nr:hypothetical protein [Hyphomicrobiales bacterium]
MTKRFQLRLAIEFAVTLAAIALLMAAIGCPDWIERTIGFAPDQGDGGFEWGLALAAVTAFVAASWSARRTWRAARRATPKVASRRG